MHHSPAIEPLFIEESQTGPVRADTVDDQRKAQLLSQMDLGSEGDPLKLHCTGPAAFVEARFTDCDHRSGGGEAF